MWFFDLTRPQRRALLAAMLGWMFDAMDFLIYVLAIGRLKTYFDGFVAEARQAAEKAARQSTASDGG